MSDGFKGALRRLLGQPLLHFLVLGLAFYALYAWVGRGRAEPPDNVIVVTAADVSRLEAAWRARWNRPPTPEEMVGLVRSHVQEIALYRQALAMRLDQNDPVVRRMLGQKLQTLTQNLVELALSPTDQELADYFVENADEYQPPELITFTQIFLDPDKRGEATREDAARILGELRGIGPAEAAQEYGDSLMLQSYYPRKTPLEVQKQLGTSFAEAVFDLEPGQWHGPVESGYGVHLVWVDEIERPEAPELADIRERVKQDWIADRRRELQERYINEVLASYEVVFEDPPPDSELGAGAPLEAGAEGGSAAAGRLPGGTP